MSGVSWPILPGVYSMYGNVWPTILDAIADGASLKSALLSVSGAPSYTTAKRHLRADADLRDQYRSACQDRADRLAEEILTLADEPMPDHLEGKERGAWVQQQRLRVDTRKWLAAKLYPKMYGERLDVNTTETRISITAALAEAEQRIIAGQLADMGNKMGSAQSIDDINVIKQ